MVQVDILSGLRNLLIASGNCKKGDYHSATSLQLPFDLNLNIQSFLDEMWPLKSVNDKIFFAGEATDGTGDAGTVSGALLSAERVAQEVVEVIVG